MFPHRLQVNAHPYLVFARVRWQWLAVAGINETHRSVQVLCAHVPPGHPQVNCWRAAGTGPIEHGNDKEPADSGPPGGRVRPHGDELYSR